MPVSRRDFLKLSGMTAAGAFVGGASFLTGCKSANKLRGTKESTTICPYCGVGCGLIVSSRDGKVINTEGDPDHPINHGALCAKGSALFQVAVNERRLDEGAVPQTVRDRVGRDILGGGLQAHRAQGQGNPGRYVPGKGRRCDRQQDTGHSQPWRRGPGQRGVLCTLQVHEDPRRHVPGTPGANLTLRHSRRSGGFLRSGCNDEPLD